MGVIFNDAMPLMAAHMVVAAYLVGGFMIASVYAVGMLRGRTDRYHRLGFVIGFTVAAIATPVQMGVGDALARWVYDEQPTKFAAIEMVPKTSSDVPEVLFGHLNSEGEVVGGHPDPRPRLDPVRPEDRDLDGRSRASTRCPPTTGRPTTRSNVTHLAWDVMVGLGTLLFLLTLWWWASWIFRRDMPRSRWFLRAAAAAGVLAVVTLEAGWTVSEVGRQPWIVYEKMKVEDAATANTGHLDHVHRRRAPLHRARGHHDPGAARDEPPVPRAATGSARPTSRTGRATPARRRRAKEPVG